MDDTISVQKASTMSSFSVSKIRRLIREGTIKAEKKSGDKAWFIRRSEFMSYLAHVAPKKMVHGASKNDHVRDDLIEKLEWINSGLTKEISELKTEKKELEREVKSLNEEIKALLKNENKGMLSRWVRTISEVKKSL